MTSEPVTSHLRLGLNPRQAETVEKLLLAGEAELEEVGPEALTIRTVAQRAGVSPATAYTYLASKNHLFAELFWRTIVTEHGPEPEGATAVERIQVDAGETIELVITSDAPGELHVHSDPEQTIDYKAGKTTTRLTIDRPGVVEVERHEPEALVLQLEVR